MNGNFNNYENEQDSMMEEMTSKAGKKALRTGGKLLGKGIRLAGKGLSKALIALIKILGPYVILLIAIPALLYLIYTLVEESTVEDFTNEIQAEAGSLDTDSLLDYINNLDEIGLAEYLSTYDINMKTLKQYMELENETVEENDEGNVTLVTTKTVTENGRPPKSATNTINHSTVILDKAQASYPYRLWWQLLAGIDIYKNESGIEEQYTWDRAAPKYAKEYLIPEYTWAKPGKYTREVISKAETVVIEKKDGKVINETVTLVEDKYIYPLAYLEKVKTAFGEYTFTYTDKVTTAEHKWGNYTVDEGPIIRHYKNVIVGYENKKDENGNDIIDPITKKPQKDYTKPIYDKVLDYTTQTIIKRRYSEQYQVNENLQKGEPEFKKDITPFIKFLYYSNTQAEDLGQIYEITKKLPNSYECLEKLTLALSEMNLLSELNEPSILEAYSIELDIKVPSVSGRYTRQDLVETAKSLLGVPCFWGGKHDGLGPHPDWGKLRTVTATGSWSTGKALPYGLDCSGFITWAFNQMLIPEGRRFPHGTKNQTASNLLIPIDEYELKPGDIGYTKGLDHVGMYIGEVDGIPSFIHAGGRLYAGPGKPAGQIVISYNNTSNFYEGNAPTKFTVFYRLDYKFKGE
jgi:hypothetical protein